MDMYLGQIKGTGSLAGRSAKKRRGVSITFYRAIINTAFCRKRPLLDIIRNAIGKKPQNGVGDRKVLERCVCSGVRNCRRTLETGRGKEL